MYQERRPHLLLVVDLDGIITELSGDPETILGWPPDALVGRPLLDIIPPEHREAHLRGWAHFKRTFSGPVFNHMLHIEALGPDGTRYPVCLQVYDYDRKKNKLYGWMQPESECTP